MQRQHAAAEADIAAAREGVGRLDRGLGCGDARGRRRGGVVGRCHGGVRVAVAGTCGAVESKGTQAVTAAARAVGAVRSAVVAEEAALENMCTDCDGLRARADATQVQLPWAMGVSAADVEIA